MSLTDPEFEVLHDLGRRLALDDPDLARALSRPVIGPPTVGVMAAAPSPRAKTSDDSSAWVASLFTAWTVAVAIVILSVRAGLGPILMLGLVVVDLALAIAAVPVRKRLASRRRARRPGGRAGSRRRTGRRSSYN